ncbi:hypothetical protein HPP92_023646 [Vanilla planifolia]|uniref:Uncharacterized protein n=1 Tax=Vanilla planifolia TaxID=51239 RepID=A0A835PVR3_VANPL|nr:hypothetical protein HPP92_023646 [Vanilla planifolia]
MKDVNPRGFADLNTGAAHIENTSPHDHLLRKKLRFTMNNLKLDPEQDHPLHTNLDEKITLDVKVKAEALMVTDFNGYGIETSRFI